MNQDAIITLCVVILALVLFVTELLSIDLVALLMMAALMLTGVVSPKEGVAGFGDDATLTVAFMFVLSAAVLKTGALQYLGNRLSVLFRNNFYLGLMSMMLVACSISAFINNTPIVAVLIPVMIQIAHASGHSPSQTLMPLSFAVLLGGTVTLIGTSSNLVVSGVSVKCGGPPLQLFDQTEFGLVYAGVGMLFVALIAVRFLPKREKETDLQEKFDMRAYLTEIVLLPNAPAVGQRILESDLIRELDLDIREVRRDEVRYSMPSGDFILRSGDVLKVRCNVEKIKKLKDKARIQLYPPVKIGDDDLKGSSSALVEMVLTSNSAFEGKTLRELDFRHSYRAIPLAIQHREEVLHENFYDVPLRAGDIILAEVKNHFIKELKRMEYGRESPFALLSEEPVVDFNKKAFLLVSSIIVAVVLFASMGILPTLSGAIVGVCILVLSRYMTMREVYQSIGWDTIFLLAGTLSLGTAMKNSGLDRIIAEGLVYGLSFMGKNAILVGLYAVTAILTQIMSNNATAALLTPIAVAMATQLQAPVLPFLIAVAFGASASFMTPIGYQTNAMIYGAGSYRFVDFIRAGGWLNLALLVLSALLLPVFFPV
jgi:di/tricarboxylate transporter